MPALGIVPTFTGTRTRHETEVLALLEDQHADLLLPAIPRRVVVADAAVAGEPVTRFAPYSEERFRWPGSVHRATGPAQAWRAGATGDLPPPRLRPRAGRPL